MRLKQNLTLGVLIILLVSAIFSINTLNLISVEKYSDSAGREIKVSTNQLPQTEKKTNIALVWDVSGSMWGQVEGNSKIETSKKILNKIINEFPQEVYLGLRVFGSKEDNTENSFLVIPLARDNREELLDLVAKVKPAGKSPIGLNLVKAGEDLEVLEGEKHILLITDGKDTGNIMPGEVVKKLNKKGIKTNIIQVGDINKISQLQLKSLSTLGQGRYFTYFEEERVVPTINLN